MRETGDPTRETDTAAEVPRARATTVHISWSREANAMGRTENDQLIYIYSIIYICIYTYNIYMWLSGVKYDNLSFFNTHVFIGAIVFLALKNAIALIKTMAQKATEISYLTPLSHNYP